MVMAMRESGLQSLGLGSVLEVFARGQLPATASDLVTEVFGPEGARGSLVISGANGMVGAGKAMQLGARLLPFGVRVVGLDFPGTPDGIGGQYPGLASAFGKTRAGQIMAGIVRLTYDGRTLPPELGGLKPAFLLEAIPELLDVKKAHYKIFRGAFPGIEIRSVTSGFPASELGVGIAHPAFPHEINKVWEIVEPKPSPITQLLWALGLVPVPVGDHWSFVLDVLFCGVTHAGILYHRACNMPYWKIDKWVRKLIGPNPFRAHDVIGAQGANFLTWSCLHHLAEHYGELFRPTPELEAHKESGIDWYPPNHFRPVVDWKLETRELEDLETWILGPLFQMTGLLLHERRAELPFINAVGELCAQFRKGVLALVRDVGADQVRERVAAYHRLHPAAGERAWHPEAFEAIEQPAGQQLYVNAEHNGEVGVIAIGRESYNSDVDVELNRAVDWLKKAGVERVIVTGDFHLATQMVGADTSEFYPALERTEEGIRVSETWSRTARRLATDFKTSVAFVNGKRCLGGFLELLMHCHHLVSVEDADLGMPEVTLPVVPGLEGCHWPFRKTSAEAWPKLLRLLLTGRSVKARDGVPWLVDFAGPMDAALQMAWRLATGDESGVRRRSLAESPLEGVADAVGELPAADSPATEAARRAILENIRASCAAPLGDALSIQARHSAGFMVSEPCLKGVIGSDYAKTMRI